VGSWSYVHTNLHAKGAQFVFLDGHAGRFHQTAYWDFTVNRPRVNDPGLAWIP